jgi:beta-glucosidase
MIALALLALLSSSPAHAQDPFLWGTANASFQAEGTPAPSDWLEWTHQPNRIKDGSNADVATDFWNRYDEDFALAQQLGTNAFRMSLAWERIEPQPGVFDEEALAHYEAMLVAMRARGLEPVVTLWHSALPIWLAHNHGILAKDFDERFAVYAEKAVARLSAPPASVRYWMTLNEPATQAEGKYIDGEDPSDYVNRKGAIKSMPNDTLRFMRAMVAQVKAHLAAAARIRALAIPGLKIGVATDWTVLQTKDGNPLEKLIQYFSTRIYDRFFLDGIVFGKNDLCSDLGPLCPRFKLPGGKSSVDYIGVNYYTRQIITAKLFPPMIDMSNGPGPVSDRDMEIYPPGLEMALKAVWDDYHVPPMVSENGIADADDHMRPKFLADHLVYLKKAIVDDGVPVLGYLYWSLTDNFNWSGGLKERLGLVEIDYATLERKPRPSFAVFRDLIRNFP